MIVVDSSAVLVLLLGDDTSDSVVERIRVAEELHAPHLIDVEIVQALRGMTRRGVVSEDRATDARADFDDLPILRYPHQPFAVRAWQLRDNVTAYDAMFVALAERLGLPLVTADAKLARAAGIRAEVELYA